MLTVTATDLPRLLACNGSRLMGGFTPPIEADDTLRKEGDAAHWVAQQVHSGQITAVELIDRKAPNGVYITVEMVDYLESYITAIGTAADGTTVETDLSYAGTGWQVNGRADGVRYIAAEQHLIIPDLKYGWHIVEPENNWTLLSHVFGWINANPHLPVVKATLEIHQPRPPHHDGRVRPWTIDRQQIDQLYNFMRWHLENIARAGEGTDLLKTGSHCYKCPAMAYCPAARAAALNAIDASEMAFVSTVDNKQLSMYLDYFTRAAAHLKQIKESFEDLAMQRMRHGEVVDNYGIAQGQGNRKWQDHVTPDFLQMLTGKDLSKKVLLSPAQVEKQGVDKAVVSAFVERGLTEAKVVRMDANAKAKKMFNNP